MNQDLFLQLLKDNSAQGQLIDAYKIQKQSIIDQVIQFFSNVITYGPIALFNAEKICISKQSSTYVAQLRKNYETIFGLNEQTESTNYIDKTQEYFKKYFNEQIQDLPYQYFLSELSENLYIKSVTKNDWLDQVQEILEVSTIQEINQTQILSEQFESDTYLKERKSIFNYDGDEERTPQQSEEDEQALNKYQKNKKEKETQNPEGDEQGYEASNSDHNTKASKIPRRIMQRRKQGNNQEFDTDRENKQKE